MKKRRITRWLALALAGAMLSTSTPASVYAIETGTEVTQEELAVSFVNTDVKTGDTLKVQATGGTGEGYTYCWTVGKSDQIVSETDSYTPKQEDLQQMIRVRVTCAEEVADAELLYSELPVVYINTENKAEIKDKENYVNANMVMQGNGEYKSSKMYSGAIEIRGRGNITWGYLKKPYKIKLKKSKNILGMGKSKHWVLLANYTDVSLMRNTTSYDLSGKMGMPHMETIWTDVVLNGKYIGNYQFCEQVKVSEGRVNIFDWEACAENVAEAIAAQEGMADSGPLEDAMTKDLSWSTTKTFTFEGKTYQVDQYGIEIPNITGGYLLELDEYYDEPSEFRTKKNQPIMFKSPEFVAEDSEMMRYVQGYVQAFEDASGSTDFMTQYNGKKVHYSELFDMGSLIDYWLVNEIYYNSEINRKSTYMYKDTDSLMKMGPIWDMDWSSNGEGETYFTDKWATWERNENAQKDMWYKDLVGDPYFVLKAQERYWQIRETILEEMIKEDGIFDRTYAMLRNSGRVNSEMWHYPGIHKKDFDGSVNDFTSWMKAHIAWMDQQFETESSILTSLSTYWNSSDVVSIERITADGKSLSADTISNHAAATYVSEIGKDLKLTLKTIPKYVDGKGLRVYVNEKQALELDQLQEEQEVTIRSEFLGSDADTKSVVRMDVIDLSEHTQPLVCSTYFSVRMKEQETPTSRIEITTLPTKTVYWKGEELNLDGMTVTRFNPDGTSEILEKYAVEGYDSLTVGSQSVLIQSGELETTLPVKVFRKGDVTVDGEINLLDLRAMLRHICSKSLLSEELIAVGDIVPDGKINLLDLRRMLRFICNKDTSEF